MKTPMFHQRHWKVNTDILRENSIDKKNYFVEFAAVAVREHNYYRYIHGVPDVASFSADV